MAMSGSLARMDLNLFVVFDCIYQEGSLTRAAERLHISQPAVSHALARLREHCNDPLFERQGKGVLPTPLAKAMIEPVRQALAQLETTLLPSPSFDPALATRVFSLGARDMMESTTLPKLMAMLERSAPLVQLRTLRVPRKELSHALLAGKIDLAADVLVPVNQEIEHEKIASEKLVVALRHDHPLLQQSWDEQRYLSARHVQVSSRVEGMGIEDFALARTGVMRTVALRCQNYHAAVAVVQHTDMLLTLPENFARALSGIELRSFPFALEPIELYLYWPRKAASDLGLQWLRAQIKAALC